MPPILVYGAAGHTGRFIVAELLRRGHAPVLAGRDGARLAALAAALAPGLEVRGTAVDDASGLDRLLAGTAAVIHAAGPFAMTAAPLAQAALRARVPYLDIAAEPDVAAETIERFAAPAERAGVALAPALGFYGALGHLAAAAALGGERQADSIELAYALSSWHPTAGTRHTIRAAEARRGGRRLVFADGRLQLRDDAAPTRDWTFPPPVGRQRVVSEFTTADAITLTQRFDVGALLQHMTLAPLADLSHPDEQPPPAVDALGRSAQSFLIEATVRRGPRTRRAVVRGQDIYAVTAPIVVEAALRLLAAPGRLRGLVTASDLGDAAGFLHALEPQHLRLELG